MMPEDSSGMFQGLSSLSSIDLRKFDTSKVTNMSEMFCACKKLKSLDLSSFN
ncbi:MAG: BspA family leucine-rich repeat surface protein [Lachnospiraceae bacterium]|nr:BspA family leucine-rich repeat surface protein [Lachnospiraceae bacterium]